MAAGKKYCVDFMHDDEVDVWIATSKDVPGLILEGDSVDSLMKRVETAIPDLLETETFPVLRNAKLEYV